MANTSIEQEIMSKLQCLDQAQKERVLAYVDSELQATRPALREWLRQATALREELRNKYGRGHFFGVQAMLNHIREEGSWPRRS